MEKNFSSNQFPSSNDPEQEKRKSPVPWDFHKAKSVNTKTLTTLFSNNLPRHEGEIIPQLKKMAKLGVREASSILGLLYEHGIYGAKQSFKSAFHWYQLAAEKGDAPSQAYLSAMYRDGLGVEQSDSQAFRYARLAADQGNIIGTFYLGECYANGIGTEKSPTDAFRCFQIAAADGFIPAMDKLSEAYETGSGIAKSEKKATDLRKQIFEQYEIEIKSDRASPNDLAVTGLLFEKGKGVPQSYEKAFHYYQQSADQNYPMGQYLLGLCYEEGKGVGQSLEKAIEYYKKATTQGYCLAMGALGKCLLKNKIDQEEGVKYLKLAIQNVSECGKQLLGLYQLDLAECYEQGTGVIKSDQNALHYYNLSANNGNMISQLRLGNAYREGSLGLSKSLEKAFHYYELAANQGCVSALSELGECYEQGIGTPQSPKKAFDCYKNAAKLDDTFGLIFNKMGRCYENGIGTDKSLVKAIYYYQLAGHQDYPLGHYHAGLCYQQIEGEEAAKNAIACFKLSVRDVGIGQEELDTLFKKTKEGNISKNHKKFLAEFNENELHSLIQSMLNEAPGLDEKTLEKMKNEAEEGDLQSQLILAHAYELGYGVNKSENEAFRLYKLASENGSLEAYWQLYFSYLHGIGVEKSLYKAHECLEILAAQGNDLAKTKLKTDFKDRENAEKYKLAAEKGNAVAQFNLGLFYTYGRGGLPKSYEKAIEYYKLAADQGNSDAQSNLAWFYLKGFGGLEKSDEKAIEYYKLAADKGQSTAQFMLGSAYAFGKGGLPQSYEKAVEYYLLAANQGHPKAQNNLGVFYEKGIGGLEQSDEKAVEYYHLAADQGESTAQCNVGLYYKLGKGGLKQSDEKAIEYYTLAANQDNDSAKKALESIRSKKSKKAV